MCYRWQGKSGERWIAPCLLLKKSRQLLTGISQGIASLLPLSKHAPLFINEGRNISFSGMSEDTPIDSNRKARPSSGHRLRGSSSGNGFDTIFTDEFVN